MPPPVPGTRQAPTGTRMDEGHQTLVSFAADPDASYWEKTVTPPGVDGGDPVDTTTMHNVDWRTKNPRVLAEMTEFSFTAAYDPAFILTILAILNVKTTVTVHYPNGGRLAFFGFLRGFEADSIEEGAQPEATATVVPTNQDPTTGAEQAPVYDPPGT